METPDQTTDKKNYILKPVKMTPRQIEKAQELKNKYLQEQNECLDELKKMVENKEITVVDLVRSVKSYRKILDSRNKHAKANYEKNKDELKAVRDEAKGYYDSIKERVEAYKEQLLKEEMAKINKEVIDISNNLIVSERPAKRTSKKTPKV